MADGEVLFRVEVDAGQALEQLQAVSSEISTLQRVNADLQSEMKRTNTQTKEGAKAYTEMKLAVAENNTNIKSLQQSEKSLTNQLISSNIEVKKVTDSFKEQARQLNLLKEQYSSLSAEQRRSPLGKEMLINLQKLDKQVKLNEGSIGNFQRNVGNYSSALKGLGSSARLVGSSMQAANGSITAVGTSLKALGAANPILGALTIAGAAFVKIWQDLATKTKKAKEELENYLKKFREISGITGGLKNYDEGAIRSELMRAQMQAPLAKNAKEWNALNTQIGVYTRQLAIIHEYEGMTLEDLENKEKEYRKLYEIGTIFNKRDIERYEILQNIIGKRKSATGTTTTGAGTTTATGGNTGKTLSEILNISGDEEEKESQKSLKFWGKYWTDWGKQLEDANNLAKKDKDGLIESLEDLTNQRLADIDAEEQRAQEWARTESEVTQQVADAYAQLSGGMSQVFSAMGEEGSAFAAFGKALAIAESIFNIQKAVAAATAAGAGLPFPANLVAMASGIATVMANVAGIITSIKSVAIPESPKFSTGGVVPGNSYVGDKVTAGLNSGEVVLNSGQQSNLLMKLAKSQSPVIQQDMNMLQSALVNALRAMPAPVLTYKEFNNFQQKVVKYREYEKF